MGHKTSARARHGIFINSVVAGYLTAEFTENWWGRIAIMSVIIVSLLLVANGEE